MAGDQRVRPGRARLLAVAALVGVLLGALAFVVSPLPLRPEARAADPSRAADHPTVAAVPTSAGPGDPTPTPRRSPRPSASASPAPSPTGGPAFTARALLQTSEFLEHGWVKAAQLSLQDGVVSPPLLPCLRLDQLPDAPVAAYAATYQGLHTLAAEQVARLRSTTEAKAALAWLTTQVEGCDQAPASERVTVGKRHEPDLEGVSQTVWWNVRGAGTDDPMRGVLVLVRVDDRFVALYLHATTTDPATTTDVLPLMRQAGLRLV